MASVSETRCGEDVRRRSPADEAADTAGVAAMCSGGQKVSAGDATARTSVRWAR